MIIDEYYSNIDKNNFYLGKISQVYESNSYVQVENLSLLANRKIHREVLTPNTINYLTVIENDCGLFVGEVYQSKIPNSDSVHDALKINSKEKIYPELGINIIGFQSNNAKGLELPGFRTVGIGDKVYLVNSKFISMYAQSLEVNDYYKKEIQDGKEEKIKQRKIKNFSKFSDLENQYFCVQPNTLFDRHLLSIGATNSGKSTSALAILNQMLVTGRKALVIDPTGEYKDTFRDEEMEKLTLGKNTAVDIGQISIPQWGLIFQTNDNTQGAILANAIESLRYQYKNNDKNEIYTKKNKKVSQVTYDMNSLNNEDIAFNVSLLPKQIKEESVKVNKERYIFDEFNFNSNSWLINKVKYVLKNTRLLDFFSDDKDFDLLKKTQNFLNNVNKGLYIDASLIGNSDGVGAMIVDLISNFVVDKKKKENKPFIIFIDEVHRYVKQGSDFMDDTGLTSIAREGRKKGIFLFLTTQSPKDVPNILLSQMGSLLVHRLTNIEEISIIGNYLDKKIVSQIKNLNRGEAILTSINLLQNVKLKFIKSGRIHHNETPVL
ncbi:ATP-binding protein [Companilactobacillus farciminis]|uniref:ATP-binding protein n=1 Tax=Companilactobacillus farciminis TaxID=1612 RepID=UPI00232F07E7|nr:ATP-binding protein [Companilactobacillus farciminis]WCG35801.1 ATP-binding protein [Companilactobacillus farciminis]